MAGRSSQGPSERDPQSDRDRGAGLSGQAADAPGAALAYAPRMRLRPGSAPYGVAVGVFFLAFVVRLAWALRVQSPLTAVYSDMGGYVARAEWLIAGITPSNRGALTFYPWGTHCFIALELFVFGRNAPVAIAIVHALVGAVPAACMIPLTLRLLPSLAAAGTAGALVALWQPQFIYVGFFLSEIWFSAAIALHALLSAPRATRGGRSLAVGLLSATAFVLRPQFLLTWVIDTSSHTVHRYRRRGLRDAGAVLAMLAVPMVVALGVSSLRLHRLSGRWGLISENANLNRLFADTDVCQVESTIVAGGERFNSYFRPPAKTPCEARDIVRLTGFIGDAQILEPIRRERLRGVSWTHRLTRAARNVELLAAHNPLFPEAGYMDISWRADLQNGFAWGVLVVILPLCAVGLVLGRPDRLKLITLANFAAVVVAAARYYGESRYRVPYDPFAILFAVVGAYELGRRGLARAYARHGWSGRLVDT